MGSHEKQKLNMLEIIYKQRRCTECGCNTLIQTQSYDTESVFKGRRLIQYHCPDCQERDVETELVEMDWRDVEYTESNSRRLANAERRLEKARANLKRAHDYIEELLTQSN